MTIRNSIDEMLNIPDTGKYRIEVTKRESPVGESMICYSQKIPDQIESDVEDHIPELDVGESVKVEIDVDEMSYQIID